MIPDIVFVLTLLTMAAVLSIAAAHQIDEAVAAQRRYRAMTADLQADYDKRVRQLRADQTKILDEAIVQRTKLDQALDRLHRQQERLRDRHIYNHTLTF